MAITFTGNYTVRGGSNAGVSGAGLSRTYGNPVQVVWSLVDIADVLANGSSNAFSNGDIVECLRIPADSYVIHAGMRVLTAFATNAWTICMGTGGGSNYIDSASNGTLTSSNTNTGYVVGSNATLDTSARFVTTDTLDIKWVATSTALTSGLFAVYAVIANLSYLGRSANVGHTSNAETLP